MITQTPEILADEISHAAKQLEQDVEKHEPVRQILPEIRDMRRLLVTLEGDIIDGMASGNGDAC